MWIPKDATLIKGRRLFEAQRLLEKMRCVFYVCCGMKMLHGECHHTQWICDIITKRQYVLFMYYNFCKDHCVDCKVMKDLVDTNL